MNTNKSFLLISKLKKEFRRSTVEEMKRKTPSKIICWVSSLLQQYMIRYYWKMISFIEAFKFWFSFNSLFNLYRRSLSTSLKKQIDISPFKVPYKFPIDSFKTSPRHQPIKIYLAERRTPNNESAFFHRDFTFDFIILISQLSIIYLLKIRMITLKLGK